MAGDIITLGTLLFLLIIAISMTKNVAKNSGILGVILMYAFIIYCIVGKFMQVTGIIPSQLNNW